ncbi:hypothetical protein D3C78_999450 [compost metagenome]
MPAGGGVDNVPRYPVGQGTGKENGVIAEQAGAGLGEQNGQHGKHRQRAQRAVTGTVFRASLAAQVVQQLSWRVQEMAKARPAAAHKAPDQAKQQQCEHHMAQPQVPEHGVAADLGGDDHGHGAGSQCPVEQAGRKIPDTDGVKHGGAVEGGGAAGKDSGALRWGRNGWWRDSQVFPDNPAL